VYFAVHPIPRFRFEERGVPAVSLFASKHALEFFHASQPHLLKRTAKFGDKICFVLSQVSDSLFAVNSTQINL
jgi:hypothetical protein